MSERSAVLILMILRFCSGDTMVCKSVSDAYTGDFNDKKCEKRLDALEEQIRQLRKIIGDGNVSAPHLSIEGIPKDCGDLHDGGIRQDGVYSISPDGRCPFYVYCDMARGGWTVIQRRQDGSVNFFQPWDVYVKGFGDVEGEHWLGLEKIHRLTKEGSQIFFHMENYDGTMETAHYKSFAVHDVTTSYRMNVDPFGYSGTTKELFSYHDNMKFSTFDRDNDERPDSCVDLCDGGGWWFKNCYNYGNFNGVFNKLEPGGMGYWGAKFTPVKNVEISIKRREGVC